MVDTSWVEGNLGDANLRIVEVDYDPTPNYNLGHIPGSVLIDWRKDINDPLTRDIVSRKGLDAPLGRLGTRTGIGSSCTGISTTGSRPSRSGSSSTTGSRTSSSLTAVGRSGSRRTSR